MKSENFNCQTIKEIKTIVNLVICGRDWMPRKEVIEGLRFAGISYSNQSLTRDTALLNECKMPGFNYFKGDSGLDKSSATIVVVFRWFSFYRSRGQGIVHLPEVLKLLGEIEKDVEQWCNHSTIEVKAVELR